MGFPCRMNIGWKERKRGLKENSKVGRTPRSELLEEWGCH